MIKYELLENDSIRDRETNACIPMAPGNRHYREYLEWVAEGNTPIPARPSVHHSLDETDPDNPIWVEDVTAKEQTEARQLLADTDKQQARAVDDIIDHLQNGTPIPQVVLDRQAARAAARTKLG